MRRLMMAAEAEGAFLDDLVVLPRAVWSLNKLVSTANICIRVRRSSDNVEQDIGFSGGELDITSLLSFIGANSGFLVTLYDQYLNNKHLIQPIVANQPRIVNAGVYDAEVLLDGINDCFSVAALSIDTSDKLGVYIRARLNTLNRYNQLFELSPNYNGAASFGAAIIYSNSNNLEAGMRNVNVWNAAVIGPPKISDVFTLLFDRAEIDTINEVKLWKNTNPIARTAASAFTVTGNFGVFDGFVGSRAATTTGAMQGGLHTLAIYQEDTKLFRREIENILNPDLETTSILAWDTNKKGAGVVLTESNTRASKAAAGWQSVLADIGHNVGKKQFEINVIANNVYCLGGVANEDFALFGDHVGSPANSSGCGSLGYHFQSGSLWLEHLENNVTSSAVHAGEISLIDTFTVGVDFIADTIKFYKNGVLLLTRNAFTSLGSKIWYPAASVQSGSMLSIRGNNLIFPIDGYDDWAP